MRKKAERKLTQTWPVNATKIVLRNIPNGNSCIIMSETKDGEYTSKGSLASEVKLIISYNYAKEVFIIWNGFIHQQIHSSTGMCTLSMGKEAKKMLKKKPDNIWIEQTYKEIRPKGMDNCVEMVVIVEKNALLDFCKNFEEYMLPAPKTIPKGKKCVFAWSNDKLEKIDSIDSNEANDCFSREREWIARAKRNAVFRKKILKFWNNQCIVCGATEEKILEAAHKESVRNGGLDEVENGYCLRANHHRMYDAALLNIDIESGTFECVSELAKEMPWYKHAKEQGCKLYVNRNMKT